MTDREQSDTYDQYVTADRANMQATFRNPGNLGQTEFYWVLPQAFIGNQVSYYVASYKCWDIFCGMPICLIFFTEIFKKIINVTFFTSSIES